MSVTGLSETRVPRSRLSWGCARHGPTAVTVPMSPTGCADWAGHALMTTWNQTVSFVMGENKGRKPS